MVAAIMLSEGVAQKMPLQGFPRPFVVAAQPKRERQKKTKLLSYTLYHGNSM